MMTQFMDRDSIEEEDQFPGLAQLLEDFLTPQMAYGQDPSAPQNNMATYIEKLTVSMPFELQTLRDNRNQFSLGTAPPTQWIETSIEPVLHHLKLTLELDDETSAVGDSDHYGEP